jgi:hypothetical protein
VLGNPCFIYFKPSGGAVWGFIAGKLTQAAIATYTTNLESQLQNQLQDSDKLSKKSIEE